MAADIPFRVIQTGKGIKLVDTEYKGPHPEITHEPDYDEFSPTDQRKLTQFVHSQGKGIVDWDDIKWGSFTKQYERFRQMHHNTDIGDLEQFAKYILRNPAKYHKTTVRRARFYLNVLLKKSHNNCIRMPRRKKSISSSEEEAASAAVAPPVSSQDQVVHHYHHHIHHNAGDGILGNILGGLDPNRNGVANFFNHDVKNALDPTKNGVGQFFRDNARPIIHGLASTGISALTGVPLSGAVVGQLGLNDAIDRGLDKANLGFGLLPKKHRRFEKGSQEARDYMATLRRMKGKKGGKGKGILDDFKSDVQSYAMGHGGAIPGPRSRIPITDPTLM